MEPSDVRYKEYLGLEKIFAAGYTVTSGSDHSMQLADENHFKRVHIKSELDLQQILDDLQAATAHVGDGRYAQAAIHLGRSSCILGELAGHVDLLQYPYLTPERFLKFRGELGTASGAESQRAGELRKLLGLGLGPGGSKIEIQLYEAFRVKLEGEGLSVSGLLGDPDLNPGLYDVLHGLRDIADGWMTWAWRHRQVAFQMIGGSRGTGDTEGVGYLDKRMAEHPFPELFPAGPLADAGQ